jgi:hypothetical protein
MKRVTGFSGLKITATEVYMAVVVMLISFSCDSRFPDSFKKPQFRLLGPGETNIDFRNDLEYTEDFNTYTYRNFYNGAGTGMGDFNNDGLIDIYFCGNQAGNKLYINRGDFRFEDITDRAGVACIGSWSTGVSIADVNGDELPDIYICKSGAPGRKNHHNLLFINNGDLTFTEKSEAYGLAVAGMSNQAAFFDYDRDGDLDCYLLNNSFQSVTEFDVKPGQREVRDTLGANMLLRNDNGRFTDVSSEAGIYGSKIGFGLGVSIGDLNRDGWPDIYISNDFFERDYLYINNRDGSFTESLEKQIGETSQGAMDSDIGDINNDGWPEIFTTEMTAEGNSRLKTKVLFDTWETYQKKYKNGYFQQFARNTLQLNNKNSTFSEIGRFSGVSSTDWSWGTLIFDMNNDGWKDIFVANGIYKDLLDRDYLDIYSDASFMRSMIKTEDKAIIKLIEMIPSVSIPNYAFRNNGDLTFTNMSESWGLGSPSFSNGASYGDLDNDGDLDLIVNNVNLPPFVYRNETAGKPGSNFLVLILKGEGNNTGAVGASVTAWHNGKTNFQELIPVRGFLSTSDSRLHLGIGSSSVIDSLLINWPDGKNSIIFNIPVNQFLTLDEKEINTGYRYNTPALQPPLFRKMELSDNLAFIHRENDFVDFERDRLLFHMISNEGPHMEVADINGDARDDLYICGAKDSPGVLFVQDDHGKFKKTNEELFEKDKISEESDCAFFDADNDGDTDLYVACGGNEFPSSSSALSDRLYFNEGRGNFIKSDQILPAGTYESSSCVKPADYDNDGDQDLFVGIRLLPFSYGVHVNGYLLENDGHGNFKNVSESRAPSLRGIGMITDMAWADIDNDKDPDMVIAGDWMPVKILININGSFADRSVEYGLQNTEGWWHSVIPGDLNGDGFTDFVLGNHGLNSFFKASVVKPVTMYINDFDLDGNIEQVICSYYGETSFPVVMKDELVSQIPSLAMKYRKFDDYKDQTIEDIFPPEVLNRSIKLNSHFLETCVLMNTGKGSFKIVALPAEAQFSPVYAILTSDFNGDGINDILLGGNQYRAKPQTGIYDASYGLFLEGGADGVFRTLPSNVSGILTKGEIRDMKFINIKNVPVIIIARNNDKLEFYKYQPE